MRILQTRKERRSEKFGDNIARASVWYKSGKYFYSIGATTLHPSDTSIGCLFCELLYVYDSYRSYYEVKIQSCCYRRMRSLFMWNHLACEKKLRCYVSSDHLLQNASFNSPQYSKYPSGSHITYFFN